MKNGEKMNGLMNREIKFRFWNKIARRYLPAEFGAITGGGKFIVYDVDMMAFCSETEFENICVIPEQFTGLTDKHGRGIYEGDILTIINNTRILANNQKEKDALYLVKWKGVGFDFYLLNGDYMQGCGRISQPEYEIIGNIHENPELLKK